MANDKYTDALNVKREINGSSGLTLNFNLFMEAEFKSKHIFQYILAFPIAARQSRPDGLTRSLLIGIEYKYRF